MRAIFASAALAACAAGGAEAQDTTWSTFNGDLMAQKFSPLDQITPENVGDLEVAWTAHTGDVWPGPGYGTPRAHHMKGDPSPTKSTPTTAWSATPIYANETLYLGTPFYRIFAVDPGDGEIKWIYDSNAELKPLTSPDLRSRGVAYWEASEPEAGVPCQKRVYGGTMDAKLHAVDADTGARCSDFGDGGVLDVDQWNDENAKWPLSVLQPPTLFEDTLFLGWSGKDWWDSVAPSGSVFTLDARTGALRWTFCTMIDPEAAKTGTGNVWASMSVDPERRILYIPVSSPSPNFLGGDRTEEIPLATSVTALDVDSGDVIWSRQLVHHDIWDYDTNAAPTLIDIEKDGETIPALVQTTKMGFLFVLNRETGEPIYPIEERPVPSSTVPGETAAATQPYPTRPEPVTSDT